MPPIAVGARHQNRATRAIPVQQEIHASFRAEWHPNELIEFF
jgi:hypothetical protein